MPASVTRPVPARGCRDNRAAVQAVAVELGFTTYMLLNLFIGVIAAVVTVSEKSFLSWRERVRERAPTAVDCLSS